MHSDWIHLIIVESRTRERTYFISFGVNQRNGRAIKTDLSKAKNYEDQMSKDGATKKLIAKYLKQTLEN